MSPTAADVIRIAAAEVGYHEGFSGGHWNNRNKFGAQYGADAQPWCAWFVRWCIEKAGVPRGTYPTSGSCTTNMQWAKEHRRWITGANSGQPGDIVIFNAHPGSARAVHTGLVESVKGPGLYSTIEGNTNTDGSPEGNAVLRRTRKADRILGFIRPDYAAPASKPEETPVPVPSKTLRPWPTGAAVIIDRTSDGGEVPVAAEGYVELGRIVLPDEGRYLPSAAIRLPAGTWARFRFVRVGWGADPDGRDETGSQPLLPAPDGKATSFTPSGHAIKGGGPLAYEIKVYGPAVAKLPTVKLMAVRLTDND